MTIPHITIAQYIMLLLFCFHTNILTRRSKQAKCCSIDFFIVRKYKESLECTYSIRGVWV